MHKFVSKYAFKVSWDATSKIVKFIISQNEFKFDRCANALDCFFKLIRDVNKITNEK